MLISDGVVLDVKRSKRSYEINDSDTCVMIFYYALEKGELLPIGIFDEENCIDENDYLSYELYREYVTLSNAERNALDEIYIAFAESYFASNPVYAALDRSELDEEDFWTLEPNVSYVDPYEDGETVEYYLVEMAEESEDDAEEALMSILDEFDWGAFTDFTKHMGVDGYDQVIVNYDYGMCTGAMRIGVNSTVGNPPYLTSELEDLINELSDQYAFNFEYCGRNRELCLDMHCNYSYDDNSFEWNFVCYADSLEEVKNLIDAAYDQLYERDDFDDLTNEAIQELILKELSLVKFKNEELSSAAKEYVMSLS